MSGIIGVSPDMRSGVVGAWPSGHVVQVVYGETDSQASVTDGNITFTSATVVRKLASSIFHVRANIMYAVTTTTADASNPGFGFYYNGSLVTQATAIGNSGTINDGFYFSDLPSFGSGSYDTRQISCGCKVTDTGTVGDSEAISIIGGVDSGNTLYRNRSTNQSISGGISTITVMEVQP
jgi:hypothetical protein